MAKFLPGAMIADVRGSVGGATFSRARNGNTIRSRTTCINPNTPLQSKNKSDLASISSSFRNLGVTGVAQWNIAASSWPTTDKFGRVRFPSGSELYNSLNKTLLSAGQSLITVPPVISPVTTTVVNNFLADSGSQSLYVDLALPISGGTGMVIFATPALSAGISSVNSLYKKITTLFATGSTFIFIATEYFATYPRAIPVGHVIYFKYYFIGTGNGITTVPIVRQVQIS